MFNEMNENEIQFFLFTIPRDYKLCSSLKEGDNVSNVDYKNKKQGCYKHKHRQQHDR